MPEVQNTTYKQGWSTKVNILIYSPYPLSLCINVESHLCHFSSTVLINTQRHQPACLGPQQVFLMGSIIAHSSESILLLETECYPIITSWTIVILCLALPLMALLHSRSGSIPHGSSLFSITISLQTSTSKRTIFFVLGSYLVQKSHQMPTPSSIHSCENCLNLQLVSLHMIPSQAVSLPSMHMSLLALVIFLLSLC